MITLNDADNGLSLSVCVCVCVKHTSCAHSGDEWAWSSVPAIRVEDEEANESEASITTWTLTMKDTPTNSYTSSFLQVLPDTGSSYPSTGGQRSFSTSLTVDKLMSEGAAPRLSFALRVEPEAAGLHTLFLRWTAGDTVGGGDSLYVVMLKDDGGVVPGRSTLKPVSEGIAETPGRYAGCCYSVETHVCTCLRPGEEDQCDSQFFLALDQVNSIHSLMTADDSIPLLEAARLMNNGDHCHSRLRELFQNTDYFLDAPESNTLVGSSAKITNGFATSSRAMDVRRRCPSLMARLPASPMTLSCISVLINSHVRLCECCVVACD